ncbi:hypothetical protein RAZWK3B_00185 [Roseobacter sp. AzwK-3b]|nr:hypothetical protein RAZWK3B_00185 [Roseobacter sp. AzwK-3b]
MLDHIKYSAGLKYIIRCGSHNLHIILKQIHELIPATSSYCQSFVHILVKPAMAMRRTICGHYLNPILLTEVVQYLDLVRIGTSVIDDEQVEFRSTFLM